MALRDCREALQTLSAAGLPFMLMKGASRVALERQAQLGRVAHDIDILVRPEHMHSATGLLSDMSWVAASGASASRLAAQAPHLRAINMLKGEFGDVDLHAAAYHHTNRSEADDAALWQRALPATLTGVPVLVPSAADRIALALAHGSVDAHVHSDWLVDIDACMRIGPVDWPVLLRICEQRGLLVSAASALGYLAEMGAPIPAETLDKFIRSADALGPLSRLGLFETKPRMDHNPVIALGRGLLKQLRLMQARRARSDGADAIWRSHFAIPRRAEQIDERTRLELELGDSPSAASLEVKLAVRVPGRSRRVDWELSAGGRHVATLRYRKLLPWPGVKTLTFRGRCALDRDQDKLTLAARPSRYLRSGSSVADIERFGALPFQLISVSPRRR